MNIIVNLMQLGNFGNCVHYVHGNTATVVCVTLFTHQQTTHNTLNTDTSIHGTAPYKAIRRMETTS